MEKIRRFTGKVISHRIWHDGANWVEVNNVTIKPDRFGHYLLRPDADTFVMEKRWEEIEVIDQADGTKHLHFYDVSSAYVRSENPFLVVEMTDDQYNTWNENDIWFREDRHYFVRTKGKKIIKTGTSKRCIKCFYLVGEHATECDREECTGV